MTWENANRGVGHNPTPNDPPETLCGKELSVAKRPHRVAKRPHRVVEEHTRAEPQTSMRESVVPGQQ